MIKHPPPRCWHSSWTLVPRYGGIDRATCENLHPLHVRRLHRDGLLCARYSGCLPLGRGSRQIAPAIPKSAVP
jgi:hypothetical protein